MMWHCEGINPTDGGLIQQQQQQQQHIVGSTSKTTTTTTTTTVVGGASDSSKHNFQGDGNNDSGFFSGSNILSSSSLSSCGGSEETEHSTTSRPIQQEGAIVMRGDCSANIRRERMGLTHPSSPVTIGINNRLSSPPSSSIPPDDRTLHNNNPNSTATSTDRSTSKLDSGIDISDQLSSLQLACSSSLSSSSLTQSSNNDSLFAQHGSRHTDDIRTHVGTSHTPVRRPRLGLDDVHVALLQEIFQRDEDGDTQLHIAVLQGFVEIVHHITRLLPHQALLDLANENHCTPLHVAASTGDCAVARHLVICGASPVGRDREGNTPLHRACHAGDSAMVTELTRPVTVGEVISARLSYPPAHTAGLLAADLPNYEGETCVHVAAHGGHKAILKDLTWYGADINAKEGRGGRTALHYAVEAKDPEMVAFLAESCRASLNVESYAGLTPYQVAAINGATGIANQLLDLGATGGSLPSAFIEDDLDYDEVTGYGDGGSVNDWSLDLKFGGVQVPLSPSIPISINDQPPLNADLYL